MTRLTPAAARDAMPGSVLRDHDVTGLHLRVSATGTKVWSLWYRTRAGIERRARVGRYPEFDLPQARRIAREWKEQITGGKDPQEAWRASRAAPTVSELCDLYISSFAPRRLGPKTLKQHIQLIEAQIKPGLGKLRVADVTAEVVDKFLDDVFHRRHVDTDDGKAATAHWTARNSKLVLGQLFGRVARYFKIGVPERPLEGTVTYRRIKRKRFAGPEELQAIHLALAKLAETEPRAAACIWTMFLTGGRVSEILELRADQILNKPKNFKAVKYTEHKTMKHIGDKEIALPQEAISIIEKLEAVKGGERVFGKIRLRRLQEIWDEVRKEAGCPDLKMLDARRTFLSYGLGLGYSLEQLGELVGHTDPETTKGYAYLQDEMKHRIAARIASTITEKTQAPPQKLIGRSLP